MKQILVFDIETVPDLSVVYPLTGKLFEKPEEGRAILDEYHLEKAKTTFPKPPFHKIVAISCLCADITKDGPDLKWIKSVGGEEDSEAVILSRFLSYLHKAEATLVSFNGRGFDLPVIKYRAMKHNLQAKFLSLGTKWESYTQRYAPDWHCDVLEQLTDYGASGKVSLHEVATAFNIPGKIDVNGGGVWDLYQDGKINEIRDYCETDVMSTYLLYLRWRLLGGFISREAHDRCCDDLIKYIDKNPKPSFSKFKEVWIEARQGELY